MEVHHPTDPLAASLPKASSPSLKLFRKRGLLVIDDDESFRLLMEKVGASLGIPVSAYGSLADMTSFAELKNYDVAIIDYFLGAFRGPEIAEYIDIFFRDLPVVVVSGGDLKGESFDAWPICVREFVPKSSGPYAIFESMFRALCAPKPLVS